MRIFVKYLCIAALAVATVACNDDNTLGSSLIDDSASVVKYKAPALEGHSVANDAVQSRSVMQLLGSINATGYGMLESQIITQFMPASSITLTPEKVDSVKLALEMISGSCIGDSITPMGLEVHRLTGALKAPIFSNFDPTGYYDPAIYAKAVYAPSAIGFDNDSLLNLPTRTILVDLPKEFGVELLNTYQTDPSIFATPAAFTKWFPGFFIKNSFGSGRVVSISRTSVRLYSNDTIHTVMAVTPEVINTTQLKYNRSESLTSMADAGKAIIVAPLGYDVQLTFPLENLINYYRSNTSSLSVVNMLTMKLPAKTITNSYAIAPPTTLLLVRKSDRDNFFRTNQIVDGIYSFYATYDAVTHTYHFSSMKPYFDEMLKKDTITPEDFTFILTPVNVLTESSGNSYYGNSSTVITAIVPYIGAPAMVELQLDKAEIELTFSKQDVNN